MPPREALAPLSPDAFAADAGVSRETLERLTRYVDLLRRWQGSINLVGASTLADPWRRHVLDSWQLALHLPPRAACAVDLGSGAGFPGLVLALITDLEVHLVESDRRKAAFLREVVRLTSATAIVHETRSERLSGWPADVVMARGLAPLARLLPLAAPFLGPSTVCLFLKGEKVEEELTEARKGWHMNAERFPSQSSASGVVLRLRGVRRARDRQP